MVLHSEVSDSFLKSRMWELSCDYRDIIHEFTASDVPSLGHAIYGLNRPFLTRFSGLSHGSGLLRGVRHLWERV